MDDSILKTVVALAVTLFARCSPLEQTTMPEGSGVQAGDKATLVSHEGYSLLYSEIHEQPYWVAYTLSANDVAGDTPRKDNFREDPAVPTGSATLADYKGSGYDRGHLKPAGDSKKSIEEMSESFYLSNISPQRGEFNGGVWEELESLMRTWATVHDSIQIVTGPVLSPSLPTIGESEVSIPEAYYKVVLNDDSTRSIGFILAHEKSSKELSSFAVSVDSIEKITGFDFFEGTSESVEKQTNFTDWNDRF